MKCITERCRKEAKEGRFCYSCAKRRYAKKHPIEYAYATFKNNAKRRGKEFLITLDEFTQYCTKTNLLLGRGRTKEAWHIDRIDPNGPYSLDNIQILTNRENVQKQHREKMLVYDYQTQATNWVPTSPPTQVTNDCPF